MKALSNIQHINHLHFGQICHFRRCFFLLSFSVAKAGFLLSSFDLVSLNVYLYVIRSNGINIKGGNHALPDSKPPLNLFR